MNSKEIKNFATNIRIETVKMFGHLGFGHIGGSMSIVEVLAVLYGVTMKIDPNNPKWEKRDYLVLSKGHTGPSLYAALALKGYFPVEDLLTLNQGGTYLPSHCDMNLTPGIDMTTGSLGQGVSAAIGIALGNRMNGRDNYTYLIVGDGECNEGQVWEGVQFAAHHKLDNLITFIDSNKRQLDGYTKDIMNLGDLGKKFATFGWHSQDVDGSNVDEIYEAIQEAKKVKEQPSVIILHTTKGMGCSISEKEEKNHHMVVSKEMADKSIAILKEQLV